MRAFVWLAVATLLLFAGAAYAQTGGVQGMVVNQQGAPVEGARVSLWLNGQCSGYVLTGADGSFLMTDVAAGTYTVKAAKKQIGQATIENVVVSEGQTTDVGTLRLVGMAYLGPHN